MTVFSNFSYLEQDSGCLFPVVCTLIKDNYKLSLVVWHVHDRGVIPQILYQTYKTSNIIHCLIVLLVLKQFIIHIKYHTKSFVIENYQWNGMLANAMHVQRLY